MSPSLLIYMSPFLSSVGDTISTSNKCKDRVVSEGARMMRRETRCLSDGYLSLLPYWTKLEILALLDCTAHPIVLA